jgi:hypothetical protein
VSKLISFASGPLSLGSAVTAALGDVPYWSHDKAKVLDIRVESFVECFNICFKQFGESVFFNQTQ